MGLYSFTLLYLFYINLITLSTHPFSYLQPLTAFTAISTLHLCFFLHPKCLSCLSQSYSAYPSSSLHLSLLLLSGDIHLNTGPFPSLLLLCTLNTYTLLSTSHITALSDLTGNLQPNILTITETRVRTTTAPAELSDSTSGYFILCTSLHPIITSLSLPPLITILYLLP